MDCGVKQIFGFIKAIIIKITVDPVTFVFMEISKFVLVLALAFWITVGIFLMWESIMPESARRLSATAATVVANSAGILPHDENKDLINEQGNYPFVVDLPNPASSAMETNVKEEPSPETLPLKSGKEPDTSAKQPDAIKTESTQEVTIDGTLKPVATSTPNNSATENAEQEATTTPNENPSAQLTEAAE